MITIDEKIIKIGSLCNFNISPLIYDSLVEDERSHVMLQRISILDQYFRENDKIEIRRRAMMRVIWFINRTTRGSLEDNGIMQSDTSLTILYIKMFEDIVDESLLSILKGHNNYFGAYSNIILDDEKFTSSCRLKEIEGLYIGKVGKTMMTTVLDVRDFCLIEYSVHKQHCHSNLIEDRMIEESVETINDLIKVNNSIEQSESKNISLLLKDDNV